MQVNSSKWFEVCWIISAANFGTKRIKDLEVVTRTSVLLQSCSVESMTQWNPYIESSSRKIQRPVNYLFSPLDFYEKDLRETWNDSNYSSLTWTFFYKKIIISTRNFGNDITRQLHRDSKPKFSFIFQCSVPSNLMFFKYWPNPDQFLCWIYVHFHKNMFKQLRSCLITSFVRLEKVVGQ